METFKNYCTLYCDKFNALQVVKLAEGGGGGLKFPGHTSLSKALAKQNLSLRSPCSAHAVLLHEKESTDSNCLFFFPEWLYRRTYKKLSSSH